MPFSHSQHTMRPPRFLPLSVARQNFPPPSSCHLLHPPPPTACSLPFLLPVSPRAPSSAYPAKFPCKQHLPPQNPHRFHDAARIAPPYFPFLPLPFLLSPLSAFSAARFLPPDASSALFPSAHCIFHSASCHLPYPFRPLSPHPSPCTLPAQRCPMDLDSESLLELPAPAQSRPLQTPAALLISPCLFSRERKFSRARSPADP